MPFRPAQNFRSLLLFAHGLKSLHRKLCNNFTELDYARSGIEQNRDRGFMGCCWQPRSRDYGRINYTNELY